MSKSIFKSEFPEMASSKTPETTTRKVINTLHENPLDSPVIGIESLETYAHEAVLNELQEEGIDIYDYEEVAIFYDMED